MKDAYTNFRTTEDGNLTATETSAAVELGPAPVGGHKVAIHLPVAPNAGGDTLDITFTQSATVAGSYTTFHTVAQVTGASSGPADLPQELSNTKAFVKCVMTVGGSTPNWGAAAVGVDSGIRQNDLQLGDNL